MTSLEEVRTVLQTEDEPEPWGKELENDHRQRDNKQRFATADFFAGPAGSQKSLEESSIFLHRLVW